jgi:biopolymer transport protein ExbD
MLKWLSEGLRLLPIAVVFATLATAQAQSQSNEPITLVIKPDLSLILHHSGFSDPVTRDRLAAALDAATNGNHNEHIYVLSAKGVRLEDMLAVAIAAGSTGFKIAMVLQPYYTCESYLAMSEHDAQTYAATFFEGRVIIGGASRDAEAGQQRASVLRHYCEEHPTGALSDAMTELRRGITPQAATGAVPNQTSALGSPISTAPTLSQTELAAMRAKIMAHWNPSPAIISQPNEDNVVVVRFQLDRDGRLSAPPQVVSRGSGPTYQAAAQAAIRSVLISQPFDMLSPSTYEDWKDVEIKFDPRTVAAAPSR